MMYVFLKTNIILDPEIVYGDRYNIEYIKAPNKEVVSTYYFGGLPLYDAIGRVKTSIP